MVKEGYKQISIDHSFYSRTTKAGQSIDTAHVDDMLAAMSTPEEMAKLKSDLKSYFKLVDLSPVKWLLGIHIEHNRKARTISLSQTSYIETVVKRFNLTDAYKVHTPLSTGIILMKELCPKTEQEKRQMVSIPYLSTVGFCMYTAMCTQPNIVYAIQHLSQYMSNPGQAHWMAAQRVIRYLNTTKNVKLVLGRKLTICLLGYTDSDWALNIDDQRSISGYIFTLGSSAISWSSKKQATVTTLSFEAEYIACKHAMKEAMWLRSLLRLLMHLQSKSTQVNVSAKGPTRIHCDNQGAITLTKDGSFHAHSKHIDVKYHYIRECVEVGDMHFEYLPTANMTANVLTKALAHPKHSKFAQLMGLKGYNKNE